MRILRSVVDGLSARGGLPALVTLGEEGVEICGWTSAAFGNPLTRLVSRLNLVWFADRETAVVRAGYGSAVELLSCTCRACIHPWYIRVHAKGKVLQRLEQVTVTFGEPFDPLGLDGAARPRERVVEAVHERVAKLGARP